VGLDMYLSAKRFASGYEFLPEEKQELYKKITTLAGIKGTEHAQFAEISVTIGYWRKANAIHGWFVRELADGKDECQRIYVTRENLETLRAECLKGLTQKPEVLVPAVSTTVTVDMGQTTDPMTAMVDMMKVQAHAHEFNDETDNDPLRPIKGYFFGGTVKDEWYYEDLSETVRICDEALALTDDWTFEYQASW
jgi:hypothetical protein